MDIEQMHDNVYDRMAEAIENAAVVLIAMSYSYKCSEYCRRGADTSYSVCQSVCPSVENATVVLIAMSYSYKCSEYCSYSVCLL